MQTADEYDVGGVVSEAEEFKADTSAIFRGANSDGVAITSGEQLEGDVLVTSPKLLQLIWIASFGLRKL